MSVVAVSRWTGRAGWTSLHSFALAFGALAAAMLAGFPLLWISGAGKSDYAGKLFLNGVAIIALIRLRMKLGHPSSD